MAPAKTSKTSAIIKITLTANEILHLVAQKSSRLVNFGFGTFLCDVKKGEVEITQAALDCLLAQPERSGLQGLEFWEDDRLGWGSRSLNFKVAPSDSNVPAQAKKWIRKKFVVVK